MLKKIGFVVAASAAGLAMLGGVASADPKGGRDDGPDQVGLINANNNNTDLLHNVNIPLGICENNLNVLGVQVVVHDILNGLAVPVLSPGSYTDAENSDGCSSGTIIDGGSEQDS